MRWVLAVLLVLFALSVCGCARAAKPAPALASIWAVEDGEKIFRENTASPLKSGNSVWDGKTVKLFSALNEIVAFQVILQAGPAGAKEVGLRVSDLTNGTQRIRGSHPLLEPNDYRGLGVELFTEHYLHIQKPSYSDPQVGGFNWSAAANPKLTGWIPDALIPFSAKKGLGGEPFDIAANVNQGVWVDVYVPRTLPAGVYSATITVLVGGKTVQTIPLRLEVLNLTLPDENHYHSMVYYGKENIAARHGLRGNEMRLSEMVRRYHRLAHRHRIELVGAGRWEDPEPLRGTLDGKDFTPDRRYEGPGEGVGNSLFSIHTYGCHFGESKEEYWREADRWVTWFEEHAPKVEYFVYLTDEPHGERRFQWVRERASWIHNNPGPGKRLPVFLTKWPLPTLQGSIDIWCSPAGFVEQEPYESALKRGERYWLYAAYRPRTPGDVTDEYGIAWRLKPWIAHKHGIQRWFTWESTYYYPNGNESVQAPKDVWHNPVTFDAGSAESTGNGDGTFFYPGEDKEFPAEDRGYPGPMASIRMKMYRRGIQDFEYMWLAEQAGHKDDVAALLKKLLPKTLWELPGYGSGSPDRPTWSNSNAGYEKARRQLAKRAGG